MSFFVSHSHAVAAFNLTRVVLPVAMSPAARAYASRHPAPRSIAGLQEVAAFAAFNPRPFISKAENDADLLHSMSFARKVQLAKELLARRAQV